MASIKLVHVTTVPQSLFFLRGQVGYMKDRGFDIHGLSSPGEFLSRFAEQERVVVHPVEMPRRITPIRDLAAVVRIWNVLRQVRPQIVHAHTPKGGVLGMVSAWLARIPVRIYHMRGLPFTTASGWKRALLICQFIGPSGRVGERALPTGQNRGACERQRQWCGCGPAVQRSGSVSRSAR